MSNVTTAVPVVADPGLSYPQTTAVPSSNSAADAEDSISFRLVIEEDKATGSYVYKTLDYRTGEVIQQFPREAVLKMKEDQDYSAGAIVSARA